MPPPVTSGLIVHMDADNYASFASAYTDGQEVHGWNSLVGGLSLTTAPFGAGSGPFYRANHHPISGKPGVDFISAGGTPAGGRWLNDDTSVSIAATKTIIFACHPHTNTGWHLLFVVSDDDGLGRGIDLRWHNGGANWLFGGSLAAGEWINFNDAALFNADVIFTFAMQATGAFVRANGTQRATGNIANLIPNTRLRLGAPGSYTGFVMYEYLVYNRILTGTEITDVENYLTNKWYSAPVPDAPSDLVATAVAPTSIELEWADNSDDETGFRIEVWSDI